MRKNIKHVFFALMIMLLFIPSFAAAQSKITADYVQSGNNADITITGDRNKAVSITIKDEFRYYFIDQGTTDDKGKAAFSAVLATDKTYECLVNIDGELLNVNIVMKKSGTDPEIPNDKYADLYIKGYRGLILDKSNIKLKDRESVLNFTERILDENNISYENRNGYIAGIDGQNEFDKGSGSGWMFSVNGVFPNIGAGKVILKDGDSVRWLYTENLGEDVGGKVYPRNTGKDDLDKSIKDALKIVKDEKASAKDISKALESIVGCMKNVADNPDSVTEGQMLEVSGRISEVLLIASKNAISEELSVKVCETALSITNMMNDSVKSAAEMDKLSKIAGKNIYVSLSSVLRMSDKNKAGKLVDSAIEISSKVEKRLAETIKNPNKDIAAGIRITDAEGSELGADIILPKILIEKSLNKGIQTINISSELLSIQIAPDFMGTDLKDNLRIELEKADNSINMRFVQENETLKSLRKPVKVVLPLHESMNDNDNISVLLTDGGLKENIGGMYSSSDNSIKFLTYKPGNFSVQNNKAGFNDLAEYKWAEHAINSMASKGIISGRTPGSKNYKSRVLSPGIQDDEVWPSS